MDIDEQKKKIIKLLRSEKFEQAKDELNDLIKAVERESKGFDNCNVCEACKYLKRGDCTATKTQRLKKKINKYMTCEDNYQDIMWHHHILHDPEEIKKRERLHRELSHVSIKDLLEPFTI